MPSDSRDIAHLLRRSGFAALQPEIDALTPLSWSDAVTSVLDTSTVLDPSVGTPDLDPDRGYYERWVDMVWFWLDRARTSNAPIVEKMVLFWHGHFCSSLQKVDHRLLFEQNQIFRTHGLGDFADLTRRVSFHGAMLTYLDNDRNVLGSPNENFARELMELFTLGVGHYTEEDVRESARAWTGHGLDDDGNYRAWPDDHDNGQKSFMGNGGNLDAQDIIDILMTQRRDRVARFMAEKMWSFFAYPDPESSVVDTLAAAFQPSLDVTTLLRAIFEHPQFRSERAMQGLVRSPIEFAVAGMRHTGVDCSVANPQWTVGDMGQAPFQPPNVAGWKQNEYWISTSAVWAKASYASRLRWHQFNADVFADIEAEREGRDDPDAIPHADFVEIALDRYGIDQPSPATTAALLQYLAAEQAHWARRAGLLMLPMMTPDFQTA